MLPRIALAACGLFAGLSSATAEPHRVIELFTSQGCSSCPPADRLLGELAQNPDVLALSFPVDYWDYIGWKDTLAQPAFTARQKAYAAARGDGQVYTPQAVIDGTSHAVGSDRAEVQAAMAASSGKGGLSVPVRLAKSGAGLRVEVGASAGKAADLWLLRVTHEKSVAIGRGENSGRTVVYTNVVRSISRLGEWSGEAKSFDAPEARATDGDGYVVLLQARSGGRPGAILGAGKIGAI